MSLAVAGHTAILSDYYVDVESQIHFRARAIRRPAPGRAG